MGLRFFFQSTNTITEKIILVGGLTSFPVQNRASHTGSAILSLVYRLIFFSSFFKHHNGKDYSCLWRGYPYLWPTLDTAIHLVLRELAFTASEFSFAPFSITIYFIHAMRVHFTGQQSFSPRYYFNESQRNKIQVLFRLKKQNQS